ncbi:NXPE family member 4-like [Petromyzon marinus]|uniref:NXPE family member 4-like isoform X1 n=1 Tax=Petromyzon marinus TaxID=7757 RepID=A0AAJ7TFI8_PETMA|nr:NXPE family member 4-like isoform X1 [Petromyzon marinus]XP_032816902.1 NXPE family member 4-like isoform X1 [Petromyzon marinus]XP_032816910.1 NXPE family member 4-like isoform X1 [Petromyzon marinus]
MPSLKANLIISFVIFVILTSCFKLFKTSSFKNVPPKLHYQNKKLPFLPNKDKINSSTTTYIPITTKRPILISTNITCSTSFENSRITILNGGEPHTVGDTLHAQVEMYDFTNRRKLYGGDFLLARIFSPRLGAASSGVVTDLGNGVYDVRFTLFWPGDSSLAFTLVHASEAVSVLDRVRETIPDKVTFLGTFVSGKSSEVTQCHTFLKTTKQVCDYTDTHLNESWKCEKPSELPCSALLTIKSYNKYQNVFNEEESKFFTSDRIWVSKQLTYTVRVAPANGSFESSFEDCAMGFGNPNPSGYYLRNTWQSTYCKTKQFKSPLSVLNCLKGKNVILLGDSTIRQWWEYIVSFIKDLQVIDLHKPGKHQPKKAVNKSYNVTWQWFCHSYPFIASADTYPEDLKYVANRIDNITGGSDTVLGICLGAHYTPFPLHVFEKRMCNIKAAVEKLLIRSPETKVIVKLANTRENYGVGILNNWGTFRINQILLEVFKNMNVAFVDAWDMTAVLNSAQVHPNLSIVKNQVNAFLSFIC